MSTQAPGPVDPTTPPPEGTVGKSKDEKNRQIAIAVIAGIAVLFAALNSQEVKVNWIITSWKTPLILVIGLAVGAGYLTAWMISRHQRKSKAPK